jgi:AbrB family looped-hinge helix DNA binding protein
MTENAVVDKRGQITIPQEIRKKFGIEEGSILDFEVRGDEIIVKSKKSGKEFVEEWCSIVENKLKKPLDLRKLKEEFYEQVEEDVLPRC